MQDILYGGSFVQDFEKALMLLSGKCCGNCNFFRNESYLSCFCSANQSEKDPDQQHTFCYESSRKQTSKNWICEKWVDSPFVSLNHTIPFSINN